MMWIAALALTLLTLLVAAHSTGSEPFIEFRALDGWLLAFAPGTLIPLWVLVGAWGVRSRIGLGRYAVAAAVLLWCILGLATTVTVPCFYFADLSKYAQLAPDQAR